jgi:peptidoglycan hydrolase-like protein with peptidoglycan-binding domain
MATSGVGYAQQMANPAQAPQQNETNQPAANMNQPAENTNQPSANMPAANEQGQNAAMQQGEQSTAPVRVSRQQVRQIQEQLKTQGLYKGRIDGMMGPETKQAIQQFQQQNNLQATGTLDQQTLAALSNGANSQGSNMTPGTQPSNTGDNSGTGNMNTQPGGNENPNQR